MVPNRPADKKGVKRKYNVDDLYIYNYDIQILVEQHLCIL